MSRISWTPKEWAEAVRHFEDKDIYNVFAEQIRRQMAKGKTLEECENNLHTTWFMGGVGSVTTCTNDYMVNSAKGREIVENEIKSGKKLTTMCENGVGFLVDVATAKTDRRHLKKQNARLKSEFQKPTTENFIEWQSCKTALKNHLHECDTCREIIGE